MNFSSNNRLKCCLLTVPFKILDFLGLIERLLENEILVYFVPAELDVESWGLICGGIPSVFEQMRCPTQALDQDEPAPTIQRFTPQFNNYLSSSSTQMIGIGKAIVLRARE